MDPRAELANLLALWRTRLGYGGAERADEDLVAVWRGEPDDALEARISELGAAIGRGSRIQGKRGEELEAAWHAVADDLDAADVDRLLRAPLPALPRTAGERIAKLRRFAPDPRLAHGVLRYMTTYLGRYQWEAGWPVECCLREYLGTTPGRFASLERAMREALATVPDTPITERFRTLLVGKSDDKPPAPAPAQPTAPELAELWSQHLADPGNLALRTVLADALVEAGDPRGEFIAVQMAIAEGNDDPALARRAAELLKEHIDAWADIPFLERASRRFERGFLVSVRCSMLNEASIANPSWVTVEDLMIHQPQRALGPLLRRMPLLHTLATRLFDPGEPVPQLRALGIRGLGELPDRRWFPNLDDVATALELPGGPAGVEAFLRYQERMARIGLSATVHVGFPLVHLPAVLRHREVPLRETRYVISHLRDVRFDAPGWTIAAPREGTRARAAWVHGSPYEPTHIHTILQALAGAGYREVAVHAEGRVRLTVERDVARAIASIGTLVADFAGAPIDLRTAG